MKAPRSGKDSKGKGPPAATGATDDDLARRLEELQTSDPARYDHCRRVAALARQIAAAMDLPERDCQAAFSEGLFHELRCALPEHTCAESSQLERALRVPAQVIAAVAVAHAITTAERARAASMIPRSR